MNLEKLIPFIKRYFYPSEIVKNQVNNFEKKYNLDYENLCSVFYRGNDKVTECNIGSYEEYYLKCLEIKNNNPKIRFLVQTGKRWESDEQITKLYNDIWVRPTEEEKPDLANFVEGGCYW